MTQNAAHPARISSNKLRTMTREKMTKMELFINFMISLQIIYLFEVDLSNNKKVRRIQNDIDI